MSKGKEDLTRPVEETGGLGSEPLPRHVEADALAEADTAVTGGVDQELAASVRPRNLVPSEREQELGVRAEDYEFTPIEGDAPRKPLKETIAGLIADLDPRKIGGPKMPLILLGLMGMITQWDNIALDVLLPEMRAEFAFSLQFLITLGSLLGIVMILLAPPLGFMADRVSRVWMLRIGNLVANAASVLQGAAGSVPQLVAGRTLAGVGASVAGPAGFPLLADYFPSRSRARVFAFLGLMGGVGALLGPTIAGNLAEWFTWRVSVIALGAIATAVTFALFFLKEPVRGYQERKEMGADEEVATTEQKPVSWAEAWRAAKSITTLRRLWYATPFLQISGTVIGLFVGLYFAEEFGLGPRARGYIATGSGLFSITGLLFAGPLADRLLAFKPGRVMAFLGGLLVLNAGTVAVLAFSGNLWLSIIVSLPIGFIGTAFQPALATLISLVVPPRIRGLGLQTIAPWQIIGLLFNIMFIAPMVDNWGLRRGMLMFIPVYLIGAFILSTSSFGVDRDIRAARAASMADEEARRAKARGRRKMIICRDVDVTYDSVQVLFSVDFDVEEGEIVAVMGTNGAGKSTLLRAIAGIQEASNGAIFLDGHDITHVPPHENAANGIVMVPGGHAVFPTLTVEENLRTAAWMYRSEESYVKERTEQVLDFFPILRERLHQPAGNLSGGEQQMVALGQAFLMRPRLLMIDELSLGLAPQIVEQLLDTLRQIHEQGTTVLLVEQSLNVAVTIAERAVFMEKGEIRFDGSTEELMRRPELVRAVFMGGAVSGTASGGPVRTSGAHQQASEERERLLTVEGVSVSFGGVHALRDVGLDVGAAEIVGIIGPNGAGKTTLFDAISGFVTPDTGSVLLEATDVTTLSPDARARLGLGRSFQNTRLFPSMTVRENIVVALERHLKAKNPLMAAVWAPKLRQAERRAYRRADGLIELLGLQAYADKFVNELSTGSRRAVDIACVMAAQPRILLLDEPSSGLAQAETEELGPVLVRLAKETGAGLLVIEHDMPLITSISHRMIAMELGAVVTTGPPREVVNDPRVMQSYMAASESVVSRSGGKGLAAMLGVEAPATSGNDDEDDEPAAKAKKKKKKNTTRSTNDRKKTR